ncbi:MAG: NAD(P)-binding domain-containing protein [Burkholderiales bacterium]
MLQCRLTIVPTATFESSLHDSNYDAMGRAYTLSGRRMEVDTLSLGFIGFGEAASRFAHDLSQAGLQNIVAYTRRPQRLDRTIRSAGKRITPAWSC